MPYSVYVLDWRTTGGLLYIGISRNLRDRLKQHRNGPSASPTRLAWDKHGQPVCRLLAMGLSFSQALTFERAAIKSLRTRAPRGYNIMPGGSAIDATTAQHRAWGKAVMTTEQRRKAANKAWAKKTPEARRAFSRSGCVASAARPLSAKRAAALKGHAHRTHEERSETARRHHARKTPEQRSEIARKRQLAKPKAQRSAEARKRSLRRSPELRRESARKMLAAATPETRRDNLLKRYRGLTPIERRAVIEKAIIANGAISHKDRVCATREGWVTRRRNQRGRTNSAAQQ